MALTSHQIKHLISEQNEQVSEKSDIKKSTELEVIHLATIAELLIMTVK